MPGAPLEWLFQLDAKIDGQLKMLDAIDQSLTKLHELDKATAKAEKATAQADKATAQASKASHGAASAHDKHAKGAVNVGHAYEEATKGVHGFLEAMGLMLVFEGVEKLGDKVVELGSEILNAAGKAERAQRSFGLMLGEERGSELLEYVEGIAKYTEFTDDELKAVTQGLLKAGFAAEDIPKAMAAGLDIAAFSANSAEGLAEALSALERIKRTGHIDNRVLAGLGLGEKDFLAEMAVRTKKSAATLKKEIENGKVDVNKSIESLYALIQKKTGKDLGGAGVEMSTTLSARMRHLSDIPDQIFQGWANTEGFQRFSTRVGEIADDLSPDGPVGGAIAKNLEKVFTRAADFVGTIDWASGFQAIEKTIEEILPLIKAMAEVSEKVFGLYNKGQDLQDRFRKGLFSLIGVHVETGKERDARELAESPEMKELDARIAARKQVLKNMRAAGVFSPSPDDTFERRDGKWVPRHDAIYPGGATGRPTVPSKVARNTDTFIQGPEGKWMVNEDTAGDAGHAVGKATGEGIVAGAKEGLGTHSPSAEFEWMGKMSAAGFQRGLEAAPSMGAVGAGGGRGSAGSNVTVSLNVHVNAQGHAEHPDQLGQEVASHVESILPGALEAAFEKMRTEAGT